MIQTGLKTFGLKQVMITKKRIGSERVADQRQRSSKQIIFIVAPCTSQSHLIGTPTNAHT